jgi:dienelactone hydrolase
VKDIMSNKEIMSKTEFNIYPGTNHGFAVRGDETTDEQRALCAAHVIAFFHKYLQ